MSSHLHRDSRLNPSFETSNASDNESIHTVIEQYRLSRRGFLKNSLGATAGIGVVAALGANVVDGMINFAKAAPAPVGGIGFTSVLPNIAPMTDAITVPPGYTASVLVSWGDSLTFAPHWAPSSTMDEATQLRCYGANTDGMHLFPFLDWKPGHNKPGHDKHGNGRHGRDRHARDDERGLLVSNSEYCDPPLVNDITPAAAYATAALTPAMVRAQQAAHGVNIMEVERERGRWSVERRSGFNRRITGNTPCKLSGPAAGHALLKTSADRSGRRVLGTLNNCAHGHTPWGTYLTCEENWNGYFGATESFTPTDDEGRYGIAATGFGYRWHEVDPRFDVRKEPNEPNRFGWVVEIDPWNPRSTPVKRTALGRFKHEGAMVVVDDRNRVAVYMGDDERNEYVYKFVCARRYNPRNPHANRDLLDDGILYVARFNADGSGRWLPLVWGRNGLTPKNGFADQGEVLIKCRQAADRLGATMMDRPEWGAAHPVTREVYMTLTNNSRRGNTQVSGNTPDGTTGAATANPPVDAANPRPDNDFGHIIRWRDALGRVDAVDFEWDIFARCGDRSTAKTLGAGYTLDGHDGYVGNIIGDDYGAPDGLWFDRDGRLWIQTDQPGNAQGDWVNIGGNVMMCADPSTGETRRFLTGPKNCEVTGVVTTPDGRSMFVGIQHPGEDWVNAFTDNSTWPDSGANGPTTASGQGALKPRSSVVVITKDDGGVIGS